MDLFLLNALKHLRIPQLYKMLFLVFFPSSTALSSFIQINSPHLFKYLSCMWFSLQMNICIFLCFYPLSLPNSIWNTLLWKPTPLPNGLLLFPGNECQSPPLVLLSLLFWWHFYIRSLLLFPFVPFSPLRVFPLCACPCSCIPPLCLSSFWLLLSLPSCYNNLFASSLLRILFHYLYNLPIAWKIIHVFQNHSISMTSFVLCTKLHFS